MALKIDAKFEGELICASKNDIQNFANFQLYMFESLKTGTFIGLFYSKQKNQLKIYMGVLCHDNKEWCNI